MPAPPSTVCPTRRQLLLAGITSFGAAWRTTTARRPTSQARAAASSAAEIEAALGGRVGVFALDTATGRSLAYRADERFAMCSTFKWLLAAAILAEVEGGRLSLDEAIPYGSTDVISYSPALAAGLPQGSMAVRELARAAVTISDNGAANLLLKKIGGPEGLTRFVRAQGDTVTRLDRNEPGLNSNLPGDPRDTTSPRAMVGLMRRLLCEGRALSPDMRALLNKWLVECETGGKRLRAGLPRDWVVGDKTGSGSANAINDVAIATPPRGKPILIACYTSFSAASVDALEGAQAQVGHLVAERLGA